MPDFANPVFLVALPIVPLAIACWLRQRRKAIRYPGTTVLARLPAGRSRVARWGGAALRTAALLLLVLSAAGLRWPDLHTRVRINGSALMMVVDVSGSMAESDFRWGPDRITRLDAAKRAFALFLQGGTGPGGEIFEGHSGDQVGLVCFAARPESTCPLTLGHDVIQTMLTAQQPRSLPTESQTNIGDAIAWGLQKLQSAGRGRRALVLLTDGEHNVPPPALTPRQAARLAAGLGVPIYAIDAGSTIPGTEGQPDRDPTQDAGRRALQVISSVTGGRYFPAHDAGSLLATCREIDQLLREPIESFRYRRYHEPYPWLALGSLLFLIGVYCLEMTFWRKAP